MFILRCSDHQDQLLCLFDLKASLALQIVSVKTTETIRRDFSRDCQGRRENPPYRPSNKLR